MKGNAKFEVAFDYEVNKTPKFIYKLKTQGLKIDGYEVGQIDASGEQKNELFSITEFKVKNSGASVAIDKAELKIDKNLNMKAHLMIKQFELQRFLKSIKLGVVPVTANVTGDFSCSGQFKPIFKIGCQGEAEGNSLHVKGDAKEDGFSIVDLDKFKAKGSLTIDQESVSYKADLAVGESSTGKSSGLISYKKGFAIDYSGDLHFEDVANISSLKLEGKARVNGITKGTSKFATINMDVKGSGTLDVRLCSR